MTQLVPKPLADAPAQDSPATSPTPPKGKHPPRGLRFVIGGVVLVAAAGGLWYWLHPQAPTNLISLSGRIEGYDTDIGAKIPGRVNFVAVREGDAVQKGQVIVRLDDAEIQAQVRGATAQIAAAEQQAVQAKFQISVVESQIEQARLNLEQSRGDAQGRIFQAQASLAAAQTQLNQAQAQWRQTQANLTLARNDRDRYAGLLKDGAVTQQRLDQAQTAYETALATMQAQQAAVNTARRQVSAAEGNLTQVQTAGLNPGIRQSQLQAQQEQLSVARAQLQAAQQQVKAAQATRQQLQAQIAYLNVVSPINGVVTARSVEPGAVVTVGKTLLTVINPDTVYLRGFVPEGDIGNVRVGQPARVFLDSNPQQPLSARVSAVDTQASFTPENIYFQKDRVRQVFGVKLGIDQPGGFAKPGMPADAEILLDQPVTPK